ncbi:MAG: hypothetical protein QOJ00_1838 [Actinomycetota bacterium]
MVAGFALGGCARSDHTADVATGGGRLAARFNRISRSVQFAATTTITTPTAATAGGPEPAAPRVTRSAGSHARTGGSPTVVPAGAASPWDRFDGELTGPSHEVARVTGATVAVFAHVDGAPTTTMGNTSPSGAPRVFLVVDDAGEWLQVLLPLRPNNSVGWIRRDEVDVTSSPYRVEVDRGAHRLHVFDGDEIVVDDPVAVGKSSTPTPSGQFFTVELLEPTNPDGAYGPFAFTLSAYSTVYQTFGSGDGAVGMHGTNETATIGRDASHGCVRLRNETVRYLATFLPLGTPVFIR